MYMPYPTNPHLPRLRMQAVLLVRSGWSTRKVARYTGFNQSTIVRWVRRAPRDGRSSIVTQSPRPHHHPHKLPQEIIAAIITQRRKHRRCAEVVHEELIQQGVLVSLSSVKRTLARHGLLRERSPWKRLHRSDPRPAVVLPGDLVQLDTIHVVPRTFPRFYVYTLLDVCSRWAFAAVSLRINTHRSLRFVRQAQEAAPFLFTTLQSDWGPEFSTTFTERIGVSHRHSRVRTPNDNGHLERFNRTIQEECLTDQPPVPAAYQRAIDRYLPYYNGKRLHLGIDLKTPLQVMRSY